MSDLFHDKVPASFIQRVFQTMNENPQHIFQVLTKRPSPSCGDRALGPMDPEHLDGNHRRDRAIQEGVDPGRSGRMANADPLGRQVPLLRAVAWPAPELEVLPHGCRL